MTPASSLLLIFPEGGLVQVYHARCGRLAQSLDNETLTNAIAIQGLFFIPPSTSPSTIFLAILYTTQISLYTLSLSQSTIIHVSNRIAIQ